MELIVVNENKLKIVMSENDMHAYGLDENEFYCSVTNARAILEKILHNSPIKTGFENVSTEDKILIQLYPDKNGGCELYVTKIAFDEMEDTSFMIDENESKYLLPKPKGKPVLISYKFDKLEHAIKAARETYKHNYSGISSFYKDSSGKYYLFIGTQGKENLRIMDFLSEFGDQINSENTYMLLCERGKCIFKDNAIEDLTKI